MENTKGNEEHINRHGNDTEFRISAMRNFAANLQLTLFANRK